MAAKIGVRLKDVRPDCIVEEKLVERFKTSWRDLLRPHIIVQRHSGAWTPNKNWPDTSWKSLLELLSRTCTIIEIGTEADNAAVVSSNYVDLRGKTSVGELAAAIAAADMLVGPDSGPLHLAAAVKTPAVVIMGGYIVPENTAYSGNKILHTPIHCSPCWLTTPCPFDRECLRRISVEMVKKEIDEVWEFINHARIS
jgi:ADP-heptose:LPS heptosyltransferase